MSTQDFSTLFMTNRWEGRCDPVDTVDGARDRGERGDCSCNGGAGGSGEIVAGVPPVGTGASSSRIEPIAVGLAGGRGRKGGREGGRKRR